MDVYTQKVDTNTTKTVDYLIVGQGLAGTCLALEALDNNQSIHIIDLDNAQSASRVAAGIVNPIKGKRLYRLWHDDRTFNWVQNWYNKIEKKTRHFSNENTITYSMFKFRN